eukprot:11886487-Alexandrium_andersonii.AAC.1
MRSQLAYFNRDDPCVDGWGLADPVLGLCPRSTRAELMGAILAMRIDANVCVYYDSLDCALDAWRVASSQPGHGH